MAGDQKPVHGLLRACPHCRSSSAPVVVQSLSQKRPWSQVVCALVADGCGAAGPQGADINGAIVGWNARAEDLSESELLEKAVAEADARWRLRMSRVLAPCPN
jgi:hypothetical protein